MSKLIHTDPSNGLPDEDVVLKPNEEFTVRVTRRRTAFVVVIEIFEDSADERQGL